MLLNVAFRYLPDEDPANDPDEDAEIEDDDLIEYIINATLHDMIKAARQASEIMLVEE